MIRSYACPKTEQLATRGVCHARFRSFRQQAEKRLVLLEAAETIYDLMRIRSNRFEALSGDRAGQCSIRINLKWRVCFVWREGDSGPSDVEIVDYHS